MQIDSFWNAQDNKRQENETNEQRRQMFREGIWLTRKIA